MSDDSGSQNEWRNVELVRVVLDIRADLRKLLDDLPRNYMTRELSEQRYKEVTNRLNGVSEEQVNLGASLARTVRELETFIKDVNDDKIRRWEKHLSGHATAFEAAVAKQKTRWDAYVAPLMSGAVVAFIVEMLRLLH